jgi:transcriptional regulator of acetoin/glycerol metabolism
VKETDALEPACRLQSRVRHAAGMLLQLEGNVRVRAKAADINFTEGALWSEEGAGTNAIGTALAADHAVEIFASEHFNEQVQALDLLGGAGP